jgi:ABC-type transport system substrate-binding protein
LQFEDPTPLLGCGQSFNVGGYCNPAVDALLVAARGEHERATRVALLAQLQNIILRDLPWFYLDYALLPSVYAPRLHNVRDRQHVEQWWLTSDSEGSRAQQQTARSAGEQRRLLLVTCCGG